MSQAGLRSVSSGTVVNSVTGTPNRITVTPNIGNVVVDIAPTYVGQTSITTLGTVTTGTWHGAVITGQYGGTGVANTGQTINLGSPTTGDVLTSDVSGNASWQAPASGGIVTIDGDVGSVTGSTVSILGGPTSSNPTLTFQASGTTLSLITYDAHNNVYLGGPGNTFLISSGSQGNTVIGNSSGFAIGSNGGNSQNNTVIGYGSLGTVGATGSGSYNTALGSGVFYNMDGGSENVGIGYGVGSSYSGGESNNILIGAGVSGGNGESNVLRIGSNGTSITSAYIQGIYGVSLPYNPPFSTFELVTINSSGQLGSEAIPSGGITILDGNSGSATGSTVTITTGNSNAEGTALFTGSSSTLELTFTDNQTQYNTGIGTLALSAVSSTGALNAAVGWGALQSTTGGNGTGGNNTALGWGALQVFNGTGANQGNNCAVGQSALGSSTAGNYNSCYGAISGNNLLTGSYNALFGGATGANYTGSESSNILIGTGVAGTTGESNALRIGFSSGTGPGEISKAFIQGIYGVSPASPQMVIIDSAGQLGSQAFVSSGITTINGDVGSVTGATINLRAGTLGSGSSVSFSGSGTTMSFNLTDANSNTLLGLDCGSTTAVNGSGNTGVGYLTLSSLNGSVSTGDDNSGLGYAVLASNVVGNANTGMGNSALNICTSSANSAYGNAAGARISSGSFNCVFGNNSFNSGTLTGSYNLGLGNNAGNNYTTSESSNVLLNSPGVVSESNTLRIGSGTGTGAQQLNNAFISGIAGITVTGSAVLVSSSDQLGVAVSSIRYKENVEDMGEASSVIYKLRPVQFNYKQNPEGPKQTGLIAEEVYDVAPNLTCLDKDGFPCTVAYHDLPALLLNEIQKLNARIKILESKG